MNGRYVIGAHVTTSGGLKNAIIKSTQLGVQAIQIFSSSPRAWARRSFSNNEINEFRSACLKLNNLKVFVHASYLVNLVSSDPELFSKSLDVLISEMQFAQNIGASGLVVHPGSNSDKKIEQIKRLIDAVKILLKKTNSVDLILENSAGQGNTFGSNLNELFQAIKSVNSEKVKICIDTAHAFSAGENIVLEEGVWNFAEKIKNSVGFESLACIHLNDSKFRLGSRKDRHENIGEGFIGFEGFRNFLSYSWPNNMPIILETPGFDGNGPDSENIKRVKLLVS